MKTLIKILSVSMLALFASVNLASAQTVTSITCSSATVYGTLTDMGGASSVSAWIEWGTDYNSVNTGSGTRLPTQTLYSPQTFSQTIIGLNSNTTYYYRAMFANGIENLAGVPLSFTTSSCGSNNTGTSLPTVTTSNANITSQNSATLNGYVNANGSNVSAWFEYGTTQSFGNTTPTVNYGNTSTSFSNSIYNLTPGTTYYYHAVAQNAQGFVYGNTLTFTTSGNNYSNNVVSVNTRNADVSGTYASLNGYVDPNFSSDTVRWFEWGVTQNLGNVTPMLSQGTSASVFSASITNLSANTTYYYRAVARNSYGTVYGSILSFTTTGQTSYTTGSVPAVSTLLATELTGTTARLNGLVFSSGDQSNAWFEWGTTPTLGTKTQSTTVGNLPAVKHSDYISGLTSGQTYYYRVVAQNTYGTVYGTVNSFVSTASNYVVDTTTTTPAPVPVLKPVTTVVTKGSSSQSLVSLSIDGGADMIVSGEKRTYHVAWKNVGGKVLNNVVLRVTFPSAMNIDSATKGVLSSADNSVVIDLKTLSAGDNGETFIFATAPRSLKAGELLVVTANMVYTGSNGVQGDAIAYVTHTAQVAQSALSANVFGAGDFVPTTLLGWVSLLTLVLLLVFLGNHLYGRLNGTGPVHH